jgi:glycyl-tRNA synthetase beta chain
MVGEFPELQGIMGSYYARLDGEDDEVAQAIDEHYMPRFSGDKLPETQAGLCASLADKLDTLVGIFAIGQAPSGDKDPFALRRAALGVLRIIIEKDLDLDLDIIIKSAIKNYTYQRVPIHIEDTTTQVYEFILARLQVYYNKLGYAHDEIDAVLSLKPGNLQDADKRLRALAEFRKLPEAESLAAANKRISNILKKAPQDIPDKWNIFVLTDNEEKTLANTVEEMIPELEPLYAKQDYETAMKKLAGLRQSVDEFFDEVMVMTEDEALRANRLALLTVIRNLFLRVADLSRLQ